MMANPIFTTANFSRPRPLSPGRGADSLSDVPIRKCMTSESDTRPRKPGFDNHSRTSEYTHAQAAIVVPPTTKLGKHRCTSHGTSSSSAVHAAATVVVAAQEKGGVDVFGEEVVEVDSFLQVEDEVIDVVDVDISVDIDEDVFNLRRLERQHCHCWISFEVDTWSIGATQHTFVAGRPKLALSRRIRDNQYEFPPHRAVSLDARGCSRSSHPTLRSASRCTTSSTMLSSLVALSQVHTCLCTDAPPNFRYTSLLVSQVNLARLRPDEEVAPNTSQNSEPPAPSAGSATGGLAQQEREFQRAVQLRSLSLHSSARRASHSWLGLPAVSPFPVSQRYCVSYRLRRRLRGRPQWTIWSEAGCKR
ncbi:hypothetical protein DFH94DRAFT_491151 [Russula ochroleuca]|uniref:Uncharacterized protein n=1 Tax=Russula ochroleuca TaxID=152965 RepID=A0A9P5MVI5_9AGAM|nr:hypothetical protein DFH94DRAFT_491151 [Russula ochroleuca]